MSLSAQMTRIGAVFRSGLRGVLSGAASDANALCSRSSYALAPLIASKASRAQSTIAKGGAPTKATMSTSSAIHYGFAGSRVPVANLLAPAPRMHSTKSQQVPRTGGLFLTKETAFPRAAFATTPSSGPPVNRGSRMSQMMTEYGLPFTLWWTSAWIISGFGVYGLISSGVIGGADAIGMLKAAGVGRIFDLDSISPSVGNMAITIAINEVQTLMS